MIWKQIWWFIFTLPLQYPKNLCVYLYTWKCVNRHLCSWLKCHVLCDKKADFKTVACLNEPNSVFLLFMHFTWKFHYQCTYLNRAPLLLCVHNIWGFLQNLEDFQFIVLFQFLWILMMGGVSFLRHLYKLFRLFGSFSQSFLELPKIVLVEVVFSILLMSSFTSLNSCMLVCSI